MLEDLIPYSYKKSQNEHPKRGQPIIKTFANTWPENIKKTLKRPHGARRPPHHLNQQKYIRATPPTTPTQPGRPTDPATHPPTNPLVRARYLPAQPNRESSPHESDANNVNPTRRGRKGRGEV